MREMLIELTAEVPCESHISQSFDRSNDITGSLVFGSHFLSGLRS